MAGGAAPGACADAKTTQRAMSRTNGRKALTEGPESSHRSCPAGELEGLEAEALAAARTAHRLPLRAPVRIAQRDRDDFHHPRPVRLVGEHGAPCPFGLLARAVELDHLVDKSVSQCPQHRFPSHSPHSAYEPPET